MKRIVFAGTLVMGLMACGNHRNENENTASPSGTEEPYNENDGVNDEGAGGSSNNGDNIDGGSNTYNNTNDSSGRYSGSGTNGSGTNGNNNTNR